MIDPAVFANHWIKAWNSHDLEAILSHYAEDIVFLSPIAAALIPSKIRRNHLAFEKSSPGSKLERLCRTR